MYTLIIVDYNQIEETKKYIERCKEKFLNENLSHVVVVENGKEENIDYFLNQYNQYEILNVNEFENEIYKFKSDNLDIIYYNSKQNLGFAKGNNLGMRLSKHFWNDRYYVLSNNDIEFENGLDLSIAFNMFESNEKIGLIGPRVVTPSGDIQSPRKWQSPFSRLITYYWINRIIKYFPKVKNSKMYIEEFVEDPIKDATTQAYPWISGCFMIARADVMEQAGYFDEKTFLYAEEMIISRRLEKINKEVWFCRELEIEHHHAKTTKRYISHVKTMKIDFDSTLYYYKEYENISLVMQLFAQLSFNISIGIMTLKGKLKI